MLKKEGDSLEKTTASWEKRQMSFLLPWGEDGIVFSLYKPQFLTDSPKQMPISRKLRLSTNVFLFSSICSESHVVWLSQLEGEMQQLEGCPQAVHSILQFSIWRKMSSGPSVSKKYGNRFLEMMTEVCNTPNLKMQLGALFVFKMIVA